MVPPFLLGILFMHNVLIPKNLEQISRVCQGVCKFFHERKTVKVYLFNIVVFTFGRGNRRKYSNNNF